MAAAIPFLIGLTIFGALIGLVFGFRAMFRKSAERAIERVPTKISLKPVLVPKWADDALMNNLANPLIARGFQDVGSFTIPLIPNVAMRLLCLPSDSTVVALFEHALGGHWLEATTFYEDSTDACTTTNSTPLPPRQGYWRGHSPGTNSGAVYTRFKQERPSKPLLPVTVENAVALFERNYTAEAEWRKKNSMPPPRLATPSNPFISRVPPSRR